MAIVNGNITIRAGSQDYITLQLLQDDGVTAVDLSAATEVVLKMKDSSGAVKSFSTLDASPKLFITDAANGKIQLRPAAADFASEARYKYYVEVHDSAGVHPVPEDKNYYWGVIDKIGS